MTMPPFPADALKRTDRELGLLLLSWFIGVQADDLGVPIRNIPPDFAELVRRYILTLESETAEDAALEKALRKAASGDCEGAGRFLRQHMIREAVAIKFIPIGIKKNRQSAEFVKHGAAQRKAAGKATKTKVLKVAKEILASRKLREPSDRELAGLVSKQTGISVHTARKHLRNPK